MKLANSKLAAAIFCLVLAAAPSAKADITVNGTSYSGAVNLSSGTYTVSGSGNSNNRIVAKKNCTIVLDNVSFAPTASYSTGTFSKKYYGYPAIFVTNGVTATIQLKGANTVTPSYTKGNQTGLYVGTGASVHVTNLTEGASLKIDASSYSGNTAIGGWAGENVSGGTLTLWGGTIVAKSGENCAGIGGANGGNGCTVTNYAATVTATGGKYGAGIGGGYQADGRACIVKGGKITATGGEGAAGIGGGRSGEGWSLRVDSGYVYAAGGQYGAGVGGGRSACGGYFYNFGGTVYAKGYSTADIGQGYSYSGSDAYACQIRGGSTGLATGSVSGQHAASNSTDRVYRVLVEDCEAGKKYTFQGLPSWYQQNYITPDSSGVIHLWLPNGTYEFNDGTDWAYTATVNGAKTTAVRTVLTTDRTMTFVSAGETVAEITATKGTAYTAPADPVRTGYTFAGWTPALPAVVPDKDTTYTATWTVNRYTISFDTDGGSAVADAVFDYGAAVATSATLPVPTKDGWEFTGWTPALPATMPAENLSVTATWDVAPFFRLESVVAKRPFGQVDITYSSYRKALAGAFNFVVTAADGLVVTARTFTAAADLSDGTHTVTWDAKADLGEKFTARAFDARLSVGAAAEAKYLVIDLADGAREYLADVPAGGWTDEHKTAKLVLRKILGGGETATFTMGSPATEAGRTDNETAHPVTLTAPYWMGVFEFTQGQWAAVKGASPSCAFAGATRPVETVAWADLKGALTSYGATSAIPSSFLGALRTLTGSDLGLNLPTEAEWEYACRAGTVAAFSDGSNLTAADTQTSAALDAIAVYDNNSGATTAAVGTKAPNAWGLYDMHGNVREWCHDASVERTTDATDLGSDAATDPTGYDGSSTTSTPYRLMRGGSWYHYASSCRSARRTARQQADTSVASGDAYTGFRVAARGFAGEAMVGTFTAADGAVTVRIGKNPGVCVMMK